MKRTIAIAIIATAFSASIYASAPAAREACKKLIEKSGYRVSDWGESWDWTTTDNKDGTWSVVARFIGMPPSGTTRNMAVVCTAKKSGDQWALKALNRM